MNHAARDQREGTAGQKPSPQGRWVPVLRTYLESLRRRQYSPGTIRGRRGTLRRFTGWAERQGAVRVTALTPALLERYQDDLATHPGPSGRALSVTVQSLHLGILRTFLRWCCDEGILESDPSSRLRLPRLPFRLPRVVLSAAQAELVLVQPDLSGRHGLRDRAILEVLYSTGIRRLELIHLTLTDLSTVDRTCHIRAGKGQRDRVIPIGARALEWVQRYLVDERSAWGVASSTLFLTGRGHPFGPSRLSELVNRYLRLAGVGSGGSCHVFRHTAATLMLNGGADIRHIQAMLGHTDIRTTARYTHVAIAALQAVHHRTHPGEHPARSAGPAAGR